jgi:hypothetical protein
MNSAQLISALITGVAAVLAATLSGVTLWTTGRREERRWRREALLDTIVEFLDGSFDLPGNQAYNQLRAGADLNSLPDSTAVNLRRCASALTRLRVLASSHVVTTAERVHNIDDRAITLLLKSETVPSMPDWLEITDRRREAREAFLDAARDALGLDSSAGLAPSRHRADLRREV